MNQIEIANVLSQLEAQVTQIENSWGDVSFGDDTLNLERRLSQLGNEVYNLKMRLFSGELYHSDAPALIETLNEWSQIERWASRESGQFLIQGMGVILRHWRGLILKPVSVGDTRTVFPERDDWDRS